jgi:hypothetical protein
MSPNPSVNENPSGARGQTSLAALVYGLVAAPSAWFAAQVFGAGLAQQACFPDYAPLDAPGLPGVPLAAGLAQFAAMVICVSGAVTALLAWRRTRREHSGDGGTLLDIGEGRSRFMALSGILTSLGFLLGLAFSAPAVLLVPAC